FTIDTLYSINAFRGRIARIVDREQRFPLLCEFAEGLPNVTALETTIRRTVSAGGDILDSASEDLARFRRDARVAQARLTDRLNSLMRGKFASAVQDAIVTMRDGRYVIPIRSESRSSVPGVVHDISSSGQTLFLEPLEIVELNNSWRENQVREQQEIERILDRISAEIATQAFVIRTGLDALAAFDVALAKAKFAGDLHAVRPEILIGKGRRIDLINARHPLIAPTDVVPSSIRLGGSYRLLVITGPNTGGKTVALKTVGLLSLMAQTGLYIPADEGSALPVFEAIYVDIGDEQSIQQSLSTFSSHMTNVVAILKTVGRLDLVLIDELGAGTDPQEGSALARAILSDLLKQGPLVVATTHYTEVKTYASSTPGVENASVEFDLKSLSPTYRLQIGTPGQSNALAISKRLGLSPEIITAARSLIEPDDVRTEQSLAEIRSRRTEADRALARARDAELEAKQLRRIANEAMRDAETAKRTAREEALAEAEIELAAIRNLSRRLERDQRQAVQARDAGDDRRRDVDQAAETLREFRREHVAPVRLSESLEIKQGDRVRVTAFDEEGEVVEVVGSEADIQMGAIKIRQPLDALIRLGRAATVVTTERRAQIGTIQSVIPIELDVRGLRAHEIEAELEPYLESAYRGGNPIARIIHGKGTGALRQVVRDLLKRSPAVARFETAAPNEGGDGATVAFFQDR
ncbi:MAG TPA: endonuclease MutS2, partial [Thermomicrobiales bacterium]|nr:endonuclease MutS2 [Thermomicrobiales bacterium]